MPDYHLTGQYEYNAICDVCGRKFKASQLRKRWDGPMVCNDDFEHRHILDFYKPRNDTHILPFTAPDDAKTPYLMLGKWHDGHDIMEAALDSNHNAEVSNTFTITATPTSAWTTNMTTTELTVMAWVKVMYIHEDDMMVLLSTRSAGTAGSWSLDLGGNGGVANGGFYMFGASTFNSRSMNGIIKPDTWQHICITIDSNGGYHYYLNGDPIIYTRTSAPSFVGNSDTVLIGRLNTSNTARNFAGAIKDIRVFNRYLQHWEVRQNMSNYSTFSSTATGLVGWWKLDDGSSSGILADSQENYDPMDFTISDKTNLYWEYDER